MMCTPKSDDKCNSNFGPNNCCMSMKIIEYTENTTFNETTNTILKAFKEMGYPNEPGESQHFCQDRHALKVLINSDRQNRFVYQNVPLVIEAFCDRALVLA